MKTAIFDNNFSTYTGNGNIMTSLGIGQLSPCASYPVLRGDSWKMKTGMHIEMLPTISKYYGNMYYNQSAFYVPYNGLDSYFSAFVDGKKTYNGMAVFPVKSDYLTFISAILKQCNVLFGTDSNGNMQVYVGNASNGNAQIFDACSAAPMEHKNDNDETPETIQNFCMSHDFILLSTQTVSGVTSHTYWGLNYNYKGKRLRKIFDALGYRLPVIGVQLTKSMEPSRIGSLLYTNHPTLLEPINVYPIMAFIKLWHDFFSLPSLADSNKACTTLQKFYTRDPNCFVSLSADIKGSYAEDIILCLCSTSISFMNDDISRATLIDMTNSASLSAYSHTDERDYLAPLFDGNTTATHYPHAEGGNFEAKVMSQSESLLNATPSARGIEMDTSSGQYGPSAQGNRFLDALMRYFFTKKNSGSRVSQNLRAIFGIADRNDEPMPLSTFLGKNRIPIISQEQTFTANTFNGTTVDENIGEKIGVNQGNGTFEFSLKKAPSNGIIIIVNHISFRNVYYRRQHRHCLCIAPTDYYTPAYDGCGFMQAKAQNEVEMPLMGVMKNGVFGVEPVYEEWRYLDTDHLSGDLYRFPAYCSYLAPRIFGTERNGIKAESATVRAARTSIDSIENMFINKPSVTGQDPFICIGKITVMANRKIKNTENNLGLQTGELDDVENFIM